MTEAVSAVTPEPRPWHKIYDAAAFDADRLLAPSMADMLRQACREHAGRPSYSCVLPNGASATLRFEEIDALTDAVAFYLRGGLGLRPGETVAIQAPNVLGYPVAAYGIIKAGLIVTGINPLYTVKETRHQLIDSGARALFVIDLFGDRLADAIEGTEVAHVIRLSVADFFPAPQRMLIQTALKLQKRVPKTTVASLPLAEAVARGRKLGRGCDAAELTRGRSLDDVAMFQYTGGTTGRSKGAEITERNLLSNITQQDALVSATMRAVNDTGETTLLILPLYHIYALAIGAMHSMRQGTHLVLAPNPRPLSNLKSAFEKFDITILPGINTLFAELLKQDWFTANPPPNLRWCFSGAAPLAHATRERWEQLTGCRIHEGYGLTEGTCIVTSSPLTEHAKPGTVGVPIPGTDIRIVDEDGEDLPLGEAGEILVRGPQVMKGYRNRPDATAESIKGGWLKTGDMGFLDEDGFLTIVDRKKDMLLVSSFNVYPTELEDVITDQPKVLEAAVVGVPDARTGEAPWAYIVKRDDSLTESEIRAHCEAHLTNYKRPRKFLFVGALPKSPVGKVLRRELRDEARKQAAGDA